MPGVVPANTNFVTPLAAGATLEVSGLGTVQVVPNEPASIDQSAQIVASPFTTVGPFGVNANVYMQALSGALNFQSVPKPSASRWVELQLSENPSDASTNTAIIQSALDCGGVVCVLKPGIYFTNNTITISPNSYFGTAPGVVLRQAPGTSKRMFQNRAYAAPSTNVTLTWSAGESCTVTWTNHDLSVGDYVSLFDVSPSHYIGVFRIASVTDANTFVVQLWRVPTTTPTALSGSVKAKVADTHITLDIQGELDYNIAASNNSALSPLDRHAVILGHVAYLKIPNFECNNAVKYCLNIGAAMHVEFNSHCSVTSSDQVKLYGPLNHVTGTVSGTSSDDFVSIQTKEPSAFASYIWTYGDCLDIHLYDLECTKPSTVAGSIVAIYTSPDEYLDDILIENVSGAVPGYSPVRLQGFLDSVDATGGNIGKLEVRGVNARGIYQVKIDGKFTAEDLTFRDIEGSFTTLTAQLILALNPCIIKKLNIDRVYHRDATWPTSGAALVEIQCRVDELVMTDPNVAFVNNNAAFLQLATANALIDKVRIEGGRISGGGSSLVRAQTGITSNPIIEVQGVRSQTLAICNLSSNARVSLSGGCRFDNASNGVIRADNTAAVTVRSDGTNYLTSGLWIVAPAGTPTFTVYGWDVAIDPIAITQMTTTAGQFLTSTQAGAEGGPCVRVAAGWAALATAAAFANQQIT